ncbi:hypothetical protein K438DRAFT_1639594, partial [Mycena galopus ATCC 62051]
DRSPTSNLKKHAVKCWGKDVVAGRLKGADPKQRDGNIFAAFSRADQRPKRAAHRVHTEAEEILSAGRPELNIPGRHTLARDLSAAYERSRAHVQSLLEENPGRLSFTTDAWTSPNHRAFVAWTVHLVNDGELLSFPLDIYEVPEVSTALILPRYSFSWFL